MCGPQKGRGFLKRALGFLTLMAMLGAPAGAQMTSGPGPSGMAAMQYYVGSWSCMVGNVGQAAYKSTASYTMDAGILRESVIVPATGKMKTSYAASSAISYDSKDHRYVQTWLGNIADWSVDYLKSWNGNTEQWVDHATSAAAPGHSQTVRTSQNRFDFAAYPTLTSTKAVFKGYCTRSM
jgi:hypothetical protein